MEDCIIFGLYIGVFIGFYICGAKIGEVLGEKHGREAAFRDIRARKDGVEDCVKEEFIRRERARLDECRGIK